MYSILNLTTNEWIELAAGVRAKWSTRADAALNLAGVVTVQGDNSFQIVETY